MDYYAILGVHPTAEDVVIRAAYKALAQRYHPDRFTGSKDEAHRRMSDLSEAYEVLADPVRRPKYDRRRMSSTQSAAASFNNSAKHASPALDPGDLRLAAANRRTYRVALATLMIVVIALSIFNIFHYSTRLEGAPGTTPAPGSTMGRAATAPEAAIPRAQPPTLPGPDAATADEKLSAKGAEVIPARQPVADASRAAAAPAAIPLADAPPVKEKARAGARSAPSDRSPKSQPAAAASDTCTDAVAALGLCAPNTFAKNK